MAGTKQDIITFKVDSALSSALQGIGNRSEFIRSAVLAALENACPVCGGTGLLTPDQKHHWEAFTSDHSMEECDDCHAFHVVCVRNADDRRPKDAHPE